MTCAYCKNITVCPVCGKGYAEAARRAAALPVEPVRGDAAGLPDKVHLAQPSTETVPGDTRSWDHVNDVLPVLALASRGEWYWGNNMRCKYIELRIDTRDGGCIIRDREKKRIRPEELKRQQTGMTMEPWPVPLAGLPQVNAPEGWKLLKDSTHTERSWPEDSSHENGNYYCNCVVCLRPFTGHKRRGVCKVCAAPIPAGSPAAPPIPNEGSEHGKP